MQSEYLHSYHHAHWAQCQPRQPQGTIIWRWGHQQGGATNTMPCTMSGDCTWNNKLQRGGMWVCCAPGHVLLCSWLLGVTSFRLWVCLLASTPLQDVHIGMYIYIYIYIYIYMCGQHGDNDYLTLMHTHMHIHMHMHTHIFQ
jgi:hypothetical protein